MDYVTTNPDMMQILEEYGINLENTNIFQHAFKTKKSQDPNACIPYFENGLRLNMGFDSYLATMSPYIADRDLLSQFQKHTDRGQHKIIVCVPHELENMFFGTSVGASGDAGNQYNPNILLDYLIHPSKTNHLPSEFILGMYIDESSKGPACFVENPLFYGNKNNSKQNIENLKSKLLTALDNGVSSSISHNLVKYCLGELELSDDEINKLLSTLDLFSNGSKYAVLKQVIQEKQLAEKAKNISLEDLMIKF